MTGKRAFQQDIHMFRCMAITLIVTMHSIELFDWSGSKASLYDSMSVLFNSMSILFFFISGYLFQHLSGNFEYKTYLERKVNNVILPYIIISIPAIVISVWLIPQEGMWDWFYSTPKIVQILLFYLTGKHLEPLWFVPAVTLIYLAAPLLIRIDRRPAAYWIIPVLLVVSVAIGRDGPTGPLQKAVYMLPAYMTGMFASRYGTVLRPLLKRYLAVLLTALVLLYWIIRHDDPFAGTQVLFKILLSLTIWILLNGVRRVPPLAGTIADLSFGIYFVHGYVLAAMRLVFTYSLGSPNPFPGNIPFALIATAVVMAISIMGVRMVQIAFTRHSRQLIGA